MGYIIICSICLMLSNLHVLCYSFTVWMSVLAVLTVKFARTIALALTIKDFTKKLADKFLLAAVKIATPKEYQVRTSLYREYFCSALFA